MSPSANELDVLAVGLPDTVERVVETVAERPVTAVDSSSLAGEAAADAACVVCGHDPGRVDGLDVLDAVADAEAAPSVVFVPTDPDPHVATEAVAADVDAYLPVDAVQTDASALEDALGDAIGDAGDDAMDAEADVPSPDGGLAADAGRQLAGADAVDVAPGVPDALADLSDSAVFEQLVDLAPDAMFVADASTKAIVHANPAATDLLGYDAEALEGAHVAELHPGEPGDVMARVEGVLDDDSVGERRFEEVGDMELETADGDTVPVAMRVEPTVVGGRKLVSAIFRDVADRQARIEELERTERRLRNVTEAAFDIVFRLGEDGTFQSVSGTVEEVLGYEPVELEGEPFADVIADDHAQRALEAFADSQTGERFDELELRVVTADGRRRIAEVNAIPVVVDGEFRGIEGAARDVTRQYRRERLLSVLNRVLRHNVRNAATVLLGHIEALAGDADAADGVHVDAIRDTADDLVMLGEKSTRLRRAARNQEDTEEVDVATAVERALEVADDAAVVDVTVDGTATVNVGGELEFLARELVANAVEHADGVTDVSVRTHEEYVVLTVADDGDGIPDQERRVLESGDESALEHGSGLGLWLVNWITSTGGGRVEVDTGADGTAIAVWLPKTDR